VEAGGRIFVLPQRVVKSRWHFSGPYPGDYRLEVPEGWPTGIDRANLLLSDHPLFSGIQPSDLRDWGKDTVVARTVFQRDPATNADRIRSLVDVIPSSKNLSWADLVFEIQIGEGSVIFCQLEIANHARTDPVAGILLRNALKWVSGASRPILAKFSSSAPPFHAPLVGDSHDEVAAGQSGAGMEDPIRAIPASDGQFEATHCVDLVGTAHPGLIPLPAGSSVENHVYYDLDDRFWFDKPGGAEVELLVYCMEPSRIALDYDSADLTQGSLSPYKRSSVLDVLETGLWKLLVFSLPDARFANRQINNCDFRVTAVKGRALYGPLVLRKIPPKS